MLISMAQSSRGGISREFYPKPSAYSRTSEQIQRKMAKEASPESETKVSEQAQAQSRVEGYAIEKKVAAGEQLTPQEYKIAQSQAGTPTSSFSQTKEGLVLTRTEIREMPSGKAEYLLNLHGIKTLNYLSYEQIKQSMPVRYSPIVQPKSAVERGYLSANEFLKSHFSYQLIGEIPEYSVASAQAKASGRIDMSLINLPGGKEAYSFSRGFFMDIREQPAKWGLIFGIGKFGVPILGAVGIGLSKAATAVGLETSIVSDFGSVIGTGALTYVGIKTFEGVSMQPTTELKYEYLGRTASELTAFSFGAKVGVGLTKEAIGYFRTVGRTGIPTETLIPQDVLSGKERFPMGPRSAKEQLKMFQEQSFRLPGQEMPMGFHATGDKFWGNSFTASAGASEFKGLYVSYGISPNFLRVGGEFSNVASSIWKSLNVFGALNMPSVAAIEPTRFSTGYGTRYGIGYIPGAKTEVEAIFIPGSKAILTGKPFYFSYRGIRIPIDTFKMTGQGTATGASLSMPYSSYSGLSPYYYSLPYFNPSSYISGIKSSPKYGYYSNQYSYISKQSYISSISKSSIASSISTSKISRISSSAISSPISYSISYPYSISKSYSPISSYTNRYISRQYIPPPFIFPNLRYMGETKRFKFKGLQPKKYQPSLRAEIMNIKSVKMPKFAFAGISTRPIIRKKRRKK